MYVVKDLVIGGFPGFRGPVTLSLTGQARLSAERNQGHTHRDRNKECQWKKKIGRCKRKLEVVHYCSLESVARIQHEASLQA